MDEIKDPSQQLLESSRFWIQRVFVPILVCIGVAGNTVTVMVLTRRRMRCSTNIYLTALAVADVVYLLFVFALSFSHYSNIHDKRYELYWRFYGLVHWLCDAASSTSVWLTVSFTLERYIAVCHPIKGKVLCTENRAKSIIVIVAIFCILTTASTTFEYQLTLNETCVIRNCSIEELKSMQQPTESEGGKTRNKPTDDDDKNVTNFERLIENRDNSSENGTCCTKKFIVGTEPTNLGNNETYQAIIQWYSAICFVLLPLVLIATFNCFLIHAVYNSQKRRRKMTNSQETVSMSNENRITIMLIGVVILFLLCQTPTASLLIFNSFHTLKTSTEVNVVRSLGNIFNFLVTVNAACNFLLYCVLSKKYRTTFRSLFFERKKNRQDTLALSSTRSRNSQRFCNSFKHGLRRNISEYHTPRNLETQSLTAIPRSKSLITRQIGKARSTDLNF